MIYKCPECGVYWYILNEYNTQITWKRLNELLITNSNQTITRMCPNHTKGNIESAGVGA
jgi:hypothetical protein